ncbi:MAG: 23S rRNA (uracil(1939)-C(5))-methyltransferase RlmD, partial [Cyanobacteria bacterium P01_F01_bin.42]
GTETIIDAYCGVGSFTLPLAKHAASVLGIEVQAESIRQAEENARRNGISNVRFKVGKVEELITKISHTPDILMLDPPRKGCEAAVIESIQRLRPAKVLYLSCNPATLARDLQILCAKNQYTLNWVQPADFFPQTAHVEALASLSLI